MKKKIFRSFITVMCYRQIIESGIINKRFSIYFNFGFQNASELTVSAVNTSHERGIDGYSLR